MSNGQVMAYHGSHNIDAVHGSQNAATMMLNFHSNRDSDTTERQPDNAIGYTNARTSSTRNTVAVKEETKG